MRDEYSKRVKFGTEACILRVVREINAESRVVYKKRVILPM